MDAVKGASSGPTEAWASRRSWNEGDDEAPVQRRDKYGRLVSSPKSSAASIVPERRDPFPNHERLSGEGLMKMVLRKGDKHRGKPPAGATVTVHYVGLVPDLEKLKAIAEGKHPEYEFPKGPKFISTRERIASAAEEVSIVQQQVNRSTAPGPHTFTLGDGSVLEAWDRCVATMLVGEKCELITAPQQAYGEAGAPHLGIPPKVPIAFEIELLDWKETVAKREGMSASERVARASELKAAGTELFKAGSDLASAMEHYDNAAYYLADGFYASAAIESSTALEGPRGDIEDKLGKYGTPLFGEGEQNDEARALLLSCQLNAAQCALKLESWRAAEERSSKVLQLDGKNVKALFRRGSARTKLGDFADARADLRKACELDPKSKEIRQMFDECKQAEAAAHAAQRAFYANTKAAAGGYEAPPEPEPELTYY